VLVVMADQILPARDVRKVHTESSGSFAAPEFGPVGIVDVDAVIFRRDAVARRAAWRDPEADAGLRVRRLDTRVELLQVYTGMSERLLACMLEQAERGVAVVAYGRGNVPPPVVPALQAAMARGALVTISSRCVAGRVGPRYGYEGGGLRLMQCGAILAGDLSGAKARLLQMTALGRHDDVSLAATVVREEISRRS
jgi:L-asparaginase